MRQNVPFMVLSLVLGIGLGVGAGWFAWGRHSDELSSAEAEKLMIQYVSTDRANCVWRQPQKRTDTVWQFFSSDVPNIGCAKALVLARIATTGACFDTSCNSGCCYMEITPTGQHESKFDPTGLEFTCGTFTFGKIVSVFTKEKVATVKYTRTATLDPALMKVLEPCVLDKAEAGEKERERTFRHNDDGSWSMVEK